MTCISGHLTDAQFTSEHKNWNFPPPGTLFNAPVVVKVSDGKTDIASNIQSEARGARALFIWTDCDREGEHIGHEVRTEALSANPRMEVKRARFSNIERAYVIVHFSYPCFASTLTIQSHVIQAAKNPVTLDDRQVHAVQARIELDLRIGYAFTRWLTLSLQPLGGAFAEDGRVLSYGLSRLS